MRTANDRRREMIDYLSVKRNTTLSDLMGRFGISRSTALRDLEVLTCSYPIETTKGNGGGIRVADGWYLSRSYLSDKQEALLRDLMSGLQPQDRETMNAILAKFAKPKKEK